MATSSFKLGARNLSYLTIGSLITKIISFGIYVYIPVKLGPEDYGILTAVSAYVAIFSVFTFTGLSKVLLREGVKNIHNLSSYFSNYLPVKCIAVIIAIILLLCSLFLSELSGFVKLLITFSSIRLIYIGFKDYFSSIFMAKEKMKILGALPIVNSLIFAITSFFVLETGGGLLELVVIQIIVDVISLFFLIFFSSRQISFYTPAIQGINRTYLKQAAVFTLISVGVILSTKIDIFMITYLATKEEIGIYGVAEKIISQFESFRGLIAVAFFPAFIKYFATEKNFKIVFLGSVIALLLFLVLIYFFSPLLRILILNFYGKEYLLSAQVASILLYYLAFLFAMIPMTNILQAVSLERVVLFYIPFTISLNIIGNIVLYKKFGLIGISYSTLLVYSVMFFYYFFVGTYYFRKKINE